MISPDLQLVCEDQEVTNLSQHELLLSRPQTWVPEAGDANAMDPLFATILPVIAIFTSSICVALAADRCDESRERVVPPNSLGP